MTYGNENLKDELRKVLTAAYEEGYTTGRIDALKALSVSLTFVKDLGILKEEEKAGYNIALETLNTTLDLLIKSGKEGTDI